MRSRGIALAAVVVGASVLAGAAWTSRGAATSSSRALAMPLSTHPMPRATAASHRLARMLADGRVATAKYATSLARAKKDGYTVVVTQQIPDMGWHFMNPAYTEFDVTKPSILVYVKRGASWQLVAFEWVFPTKPARDPLPGAAYGSFPAACHYKDGTFVAAASQDECPTTSPQSGAAFGFWHPDLVTLHVWLWYPNPNGIYAGMNPLVKPFNKG